MAGKISIDVLKGLEPVSAMSEARLAELVELCFLESVGRNLDPFRMRGISGQTVYLIKGELGLIEGNASRVLGGGTREARIPLGRQITSATAARAITDLELLRIDDDLLDIMVTWDQLAVNGEKPAEPAPAGVSLANWSILSGMFSVSNLKYGAFSQLPSPNIEELLTRFKRMEVRAGDVLIREGEEGDYYYVIETGKCRVERMIGGVSMLLAELKSGDAFGEEALVSQAKRNATVTMKSDGAVLRLAKRDFEVMLKEPLLHRVSMEEARQKVALGGQWVDVRYPSEFQYDKLAGAINLPLAEVRNAFGILDREREYILYCQSERRSAAAAFLLAQRGYRAFVLEGGLWGGARRG